MSRNRFGLRSLIVATLVAALVTVGVIALLVNIVERKQEARNPFYRVVELTDDTEDPPMWGKNFPQQYDGYRRTVDQQRTRYGGSEAVPRTPANADPRSVVRFRLSRRLTLTIANAIVSVPPWGSDSHRPGEPARLAA